MTDNLIPNAPSGELFLFKSSDGQTKVECRLENDTLWLNLNQLSTLFGRDKSVISKHFKNIYDDAELVQEATIAKYATVQIEGEREVTRLLEYYNLDAIFAIGYRVRSPQGVQFRQWATKTLQSYLN